jgi:penicillin-binding protein 1A
VTKILEDNVLEGTGTGAYFGRPAAGKTGTTDNHADGWFSGYVPQLEATVWVGYPQGEIPMENVHGIAVAGGTFPATIWQRFMEAAMEGTPELDWQQPIDPVTWKPFTQGQYGSSLGYSGNYYSPPASTTPTTTTTGPTRRPPPSGGGNGTVPLPPEPPPPPTSPPPPEPPPGPPPPPPPP